MDGGLISVTLWLIAWGAALFVVILGVVLSYHWIRFAMNAFAATSAVIAYIIITSILLLALFTAAASYPL